MKAAKIVRPGSVEVAEIPLPQIESDQVLLGIRALGLCGSDLATYKGLNPLVAYPPPRLRNWVRR
jgi:threonine dehydrogenase-like Zn-dependent dehydrogenase